MWRIDRYLFCTVRGFDMNRYLQERKGRWYFRIRVPKMLQPHLNTEISYPIWGIDINTANARCMVLGERLKFIFEQAKSGVISMGILNLFCTRDLRQYPLPRFPRYVFSSHPAGEIRSCNGALPDRTAGTELQRRPGVYSCGQRSGRYD